MMKTQPASRTIELSVARNNSGFSEVEASREPATATTNLSESDDKTARRDALSFSISFAVIAVRTGAMLLYKVGVTISGITSLLFYASLAGMLFFAVRAILLTRQSSGSLTEQP